MSAPGSRVMNTAGSRAMSAPGSRVMNTAGSRAMSAPGRGATRRP
jgi:hypothetical protein